MPRGTPLTERDRIYVLRLHAERRWNKQQIADAAQLDRLSVIRIVDDAAAEFYRRYLAPSRIDELTDPH